MMAAASASAAPPSSEDGWKTSTNPVDHCLIVSETQHTKNFKCRHCFKEFSGSATRCYEHLTGDRGKSARSNVSACQEIDKETRLRLVAAKISKEASSSKKRKASETLLQERRDSNAAAGPGPSSSGGNKAASLPPGPVSTRQLADVWWCPS